MNKIYVVQTNEAIPQKKEFLKFFKNFSLFMILVHVQFHSKNHCTAVINDDSDEG